MQEILDNFEAGVKAGLEKARKANTVEPIVGLLTPEDSARVRDDLLTAINTMTYEFQQMCQNVSGIVHHTMASK